MQNAIYIGQGHMKVDVTQRSRSQSKAIIRLSLEEIKVSQQIIEYRRTVFLMTNFLNLFFFQ